MVDTFTPAERSRIMAAVKSKDTTPELVVRRVVHSLGYRYRLHVASLPGKPDMVMRKHRAVIFVHGCFWHGHSCRSGRRLPSSNRDYWTAKIRKNGLRDRRAVRTLRRLGWRVLVIWECWTRRADLSARIIRFLSAGPIVKNQEM